MTQVKGYHAHVDFDAATRRAAERLRKSGLCHRSQRWEGTGDQTRALEIPTSKSPPVPLGLNPS